MPRQLFHVACFDANGNARHTAFTNGCGETLDRSTVPRRAVTVAWRTLDEAQAFGRNMCTGRIVRVEVRMSPSLRAEVGEGHLVWEWTRPETSMERFDRLSRERAARRLSQEG
jgi:hypothetical protein